MSQKVGFENDTIRSGPTKSVLSVGANIYTDPGIESWLNPTGYQVSGDKYAKKGIQSTDAHAGTYAFQFRGGGTPAVGCLENASFLGIELGVALIGTSYIASFWAKGAGTSVKVAVGKDDGMGGTFLYNFSGPDVGTFTALSQSNDVPPEQFYESITTGSYAQYSLPPVIADSTSMFLVLASTGTPVVDDVVFSPDGGITNLMTNGDFETWAVGNNVIEWCTGDFFNPHWSREDAVVHAGSYAITLGSNGGNRQIFQTKQGLNIGQTYRASVYAKNNGVGGALQGFVANAPQSSKPGDSYWTQLYNFVNEEWDTVAMGAGPTPDQTYAFPALNNAYALKTLPIFPVPTSGEICVVLSAATNPAEQVYLDDFTLQTINVPPGIALFDFSNDSDDANLDPTDDLIMNFYSRGGAGKQYFYLKSNGAFRTDFPFFDFSQRPFIGAMTFYKITAANFKSAPGTKYHAFTVPHGYKAIIQEVQVFGNDVVTTLGGIYGIIHIGSEDGDGQDWYDTATIPPIVVNGFAFGQGIIEQNGQSEHAIFPEDTEIGIKIVTSSTQTTCKGDLYFMVQLIPN